MTKKVTTEEIISRFRHVHGDRYDYSRVNYVNCDTKVEVICSEHGLFLIHPGNHSKGHGCKKCASQKLREERQFSNGECIRRFNEVHHGFYDYSNMKYVNNQTKIEVICPYHGSFYITPSAHLHRGHGCKQCFIERTRKSPDEIIEDFKSVHGEQYTYDRDLIEEYYTNIQSPLPVHCEHHGTFYVTYNRHYFRESNCPICLNRSYNMLEKMDNGMPCYIYNLTFTNKKNGKKFDKVGITTKKKILNRFGKETKERYRITINHYHETSLKEAIKIEDIFLKKIDEKGLRYKVGKLTENFNGWTECYPHNTISFKDWLQKTYINS